jgi:hypothetical protein
MSEVLRRRIVALRAKATSTPFPAERDSFNRKAEELQRSLDRGDEYVARAEEWAQHYEGLAAILNEAEADRNREGRPDAARSCREAAAWCLWMAEEYRTRPLGPRGPDAYEAARKSRAERPY